MRGHLRVCSRRVRRLLRTRTCQHGVHVEKVVHSFRPKSELEIKKRREHVEQAKRNSTCRTCGRNGHWAIDQVYPNFVGNLSAPGNSTRPWNANWSKDVSKTDKKHTKGKDQPKGAGKRTSFRTRAPFSREARIAQAKDDEVGTCIDTCFKFVLPSSDPVPGHAARGVIDPRPGRRDLYDPVPGRQAVQNLNDSDSVPVQEKASCSEDPVPGRRLVHHVYDPIPGRQILKDDLVPGHLGRRPLIIDDEDDEVELTQHYTGQKWSSDWKTGKQVRVVDDELDPEPYYVGWMAARNDSVSVDILAHAVAEPVLDDELDMEEPVRRARLGRHPEQRHVFQFGKYRNESYEDVTEETPNYYFWGLQERKSSKYLQHYLGWVTEHYVVDSVRSTLTSKATGQILEAKPTPTKGRKQTESQLKKSLRQDGWKQTAKCAPWCDPRNATRAGSNATHVRFTCLQCGTVTQSKREDPVTRSPETCPHENTDA